VGRDGCPPDGMPRCGFIRYGSERTLWHAGKVSAAWAGDEMVGVAGADAVAEGGADGAGGEARSGRDASGGVGTRSPAVAGSLSRVLRHAGGVAAASDLPRDDRGGLDAVGISALRSSSAAIWGLEV